MLKLIMYIHSTGVLVLLYIIIVGVYEEMLVEIETKIKIEIIEEVKVKVKKEVKKEIGEMMRKEIKREIELV